MSTLSEIAANHARMAKALAEASVESGERKLQVVGGFEVGSNDEPEVALRLIAGAQDGHSQLYVSNPSASAYVYGQQAQVI